MSTLVVPRPKAVLHLQKTKTLLLIPAARTISASMRAAIARFAVPAPALAIMDGLADTLETAQRLVSSRSGGAATAARNTARDALWVCMESEKGYVQGIADESPTDAVEIIKSSGYDVALPRPPRNKPILAAVLLVTPSEVKLVANASALANGSKKRPIYNWAYSIDGGHTWVPVLPTITASTVITGLPVSVNCSFRVCVTLANVMQPWSPVVTLAVH